MRKFLAAVGMFTVMMIPAVNANASDTGCCRDGKPASKAAQKAACKGTSNGTYTVCAKLAKLPDWWMATNNGNTHVVNGVTLINNLRRVQPYWTLKQEFTNNVKAYNDQHVQIPPTGPVA